MWTVDRERSRLHIHVIWMWWKWKAIAMVSNLGVVSEPTCYWLVYRSKEKQLHNAHLLLCSYTWHSSLRKWALLWKIIRYCARILKTDIIIFGDRNATFVGTNNQWENVDKPTVRKLFTSFAVLLTTQPAHYEQLKTKKYLQKHVATPKTQKMVPSRLHDYALLPQ